MKRCLQWAKKQGYIDRNPIEALELPAGENREAFFTQDEFEQICNYVRNRELSDLIVTTWETGCRPQELLRVESRHVDLVNQRWVFSKSESEQVNRHRYFANSHWALPSETVDRLESVLSRLKPHDPVFRHAWLFADWPDRFFERGGDHSDNEAALETARMEALQEILGHQGFAGIQALLEQAKSPNVVGFALAKLSEDTFVADVLPAYLEGEPRKLDFAFGFIWARSQPDGWHWVDENLSRCETATKTL